MADVKIKLEKNETPEEVEELLFKALSHHRTGGQHKEGFTDPAMANLHEKFLKAHRDMYVELLKDVLNALDEEYQ